MKKRLILPIVLVIALIASSLSPHIVHLLQKNSEQISVSSYMPEGEKSEVKLNKGDYIYFGKYLDEPILWEVVNIENDKALIMTHHLITFKAFDVSGNHKKFHNVDSEKYGSSAWYNSTLKQWLNSDEKIVKYSHCPPTRETTFKNYNAYNNESGFLYSDNFSKKEKSLIADDGVFILTISQMKKYLSADSRRKTCTSACISQNDSPYIFSAGKSQWYWTSSSISSNNVSVAAVTSGGTFYKSLAYDSTMGVSPALYLKSIDLSVYGNGTKNEPYIPFC